MIRLIFIFVQWSRLLIRSRALIEAENLVLRHRPKSPHSPWQNEYVERVISLELNTNTVVRLLPRLVTKRFHNKWDGLFRRAYKDWR